MQLDNFDAATFLRDHWQKKPLLIRKAWPKWRNPLDPDELAGLACEDHVESRLIRQTRKSIRVEAGPLPGDRFGKLGKTPWTLLVQAVDHHVPAVAALIEPFRFVPNWRIDDIMVSYATDGGGVGPHFDQYDVFLIQGLGQRRWQIGLACDGNTELLPHDDLRLLAQFEPTQEWLLDPGDMLYVPPRVAHNGIAVGDDCMTYSVGFRASARSELIAHYCDHLLSGLDEEDRYTDPGLRVQANPGEITPDALDALHAMVTEKLADKAAFARWFGGYNSTPKYPEVDWGLDQPVSVEEVRAMIANGAVLDRNPASRFSFVREAEAVVLFVDGGAFECPGEMAVFAERLCMKERLELEHGLVASDDALAIVAELVNRGSLNVAADD